MLKLVGNHASPYSRKMRAVLRYRRLPFEWIRRGSAEDVGIPPVKVPLIPVLVFEDGDAMIDSTPQIRRLEKAQTQRAIVPPDPALALIDALVEDYADEWLNKAMFHYRWAYPADCDKSARLIPLFARTDLPDGDAEAFAKAFGDRQVGRLALVGSNETTAPVIEASFRRLLTALDALLRKQRFVMGGRPGASDFGLFGQLSQLVLFDPTPTRIAEVEAPRVIAWTMCAEDLASHPVGDGGWIDRDLVGETLIPLLTEVGRSYTPWILAMARAAKEGLTEVACEIDGRPFVQNPMPYPARCLAALRAQHTSLAPQDRTWFDATLRSTGCEPLFV